MANPTTRQGLIDYCLRRLGEPVIEINVDPDQIEDRVDEAIQYWQEFHSDATYRTYVSHLVTSTDVTNEYIQTTDDVLFVSRLFRVGGSSSGVGMFDVKYQIMLNDVANMRGAGADLAHFEQMNQYMALLDMKLNGEPQTTYSRKMNRLYVHGDFADKDIQAGTYIIYEAYKTVDPTAYGKVYNDMWLKEYTSELIKQQWGSNLSKFEGMQMLGGVTLNGRQLYDDATTQIEKLREKIRLDFEMPADFFVG